MPFPIACLLLLWIAAVPAADPAGPAGQAPTLSLDQPAAFPLLEAEPSPGPFEPSAARFAERAAMLMQQPGPQYMPQAILSPSGYGTYRYIKVGFGVALTDAFEFGNVPLERFGIRDVTTDITFQGQVLEGLVIREFVGDTLTLDFDTPAGPLIGGGFGMDFATGIMDNRLRPRVELEYTYHPVRISRPRAELTFRDAVRDEFGGLLVLAGPPPQTVLDEPVTERIGFQGGEVEMHTLAANFILTYEMFDRVRPYLGAGAGMTYASGNVAGFSDNDFSYQLQGLGGVIFSISEEFELDVGLRYSTVELDLFGSSVDINTISATIMLNIRL